MKFSRAALSILVVAFFLASPAAQRTTFAAPQLAATNDPQSKAPAMVFIIRHAEKPMDDKDPNLTPLGFKRAQALPSLFLPTPGSSTLPRLPRPNFLFASEASKHSNRPIETIAPLSQAIRVRINHDFSDLDFNALA